MRKAERRHYDDLIRRNKSNLRATWGILKDLINKTRSFTVSDKIMIDNEEVSDSDKIADGFNKYFVNVGPNLSKSVPTVDRSFESFLNDRNPNTMFLAPVTSQEVISVISNLHNKGPGWDNVIAKIIKISPDIVTETLVHIINLSFSQGIFPKELKKAKVFPIFKAGDSKQMNNYRPISVLTVFSKIFEKLMYTRLFNYLNKHDAIYKYQFGFRAGFGTNLALTTLVDKIVSALERGNYMLGVFMDFSKAFDTVDHSILLRKLDSVGIRGIAGDWLRSYLSNRSQYVSYNNFDSNELTINCGVPQGSILGPLLFLMYINDISNVSPALLPILFADDSNIFLEDTDIDNMIRRVNNELINVLVWIHANKLSLNIDKTKFMIFHTRGKSTASDLNININGKVIQRVNNCKFLGVTIDSTLNWSEHIKVIKNKISKGLGILCKARKVLDASTLETLYYSFIYPYLTYGIEVWGSCGVCNLNTVFKLQKRAIRIISSSHYLAHTEPLFKTYNLLPLSGIYQFSIGKLMYKYVNNQLPQIFNSMFMKSSSFHNYPTRTNNKFTIPSLRTSLAQKTFKYKGVVIWNSIIDNLNTDSSFGVYKHKLKISILNGKIKD